MIDIVASNTSAIIVKILSKNFEISIEKLPKK